MFSYGQIWTRQTETSTDQTCAPVTHPVSTTSYLSALTKNAMGDNYEILTVSVRSNSVDFQFHNNDYDCAWLKKIDRRKNYND